jgi:hypothetical protein
LSNGPVLGFIKIFRKVSKNMKNKKVEIFFPTPIFFISYKTRKIKTDFQVKKLIINKT